MKERNLGMTLFYWGVAGYMLFIFTAPVSAQEHAGHTSPSKAAAQSKPSAPQTKEPEAYAQEDIPQVEISPEQQKLIGVKTVKVDMRPLQKVIRTVGRLEADESKLATVNTKIEGWIEKLYVEVTGSYIKKGQPLVDIYSPELVATQQEFLNALKWAKQPADSQQEKDKNSSTDLSLLLAQDAAATLEASKQRLLLWDISADQIKKIEESGKPIRTLTLYSPVNGFITQKVAVSGMKVMPGEKLFDVADLSSIWVIADIYENELPLIKVGNRALITLNYLPGRELPSQIDYIYPSISAETRTVKIRLKLNNPNYQLKPQMFANIELKINLGKKLMIPESAVIDTGKGMVAYVDLGNGAFEPREIKAGLRGDGYIEVLRGLKNGDKVVSSANFLVDSEAQLKGVKPLKGK
ncbi:MAG: efflux RND transporter periplasmic adaptor subunit [Smithellaceae bacterium]|jgi:Cu(I)/Ag(I) efflux system membrane fusion protein